MSDLTKSEDAVKYLKKATTPRGWRRRCDAVKKANGGRHPSWWIKEVLDSNLFRTTMDSNKS